MLKKKKPKVMSFTIDASDVPALPPSGGALTVVKKPKKTTKAPSTEGGKRAPKTKINGSKAARQKVRQQALDEEEMSTLGLDYDVDFDAPDFEDDDDDGMSITRKKSKGDMPVTKKRREDFAEALPVVEPVTKNRISKVDRRKVNSIVGDSADEILGMIEDEQFDSALKMVKKRLLQTMIDMIPQLETGMRNSDGRYGGHALNNTVQTIRELVIDFEQAQDRGAVGETIVETIVKPSIRDIATTIVEEATTLLGDLKDVVDQDTYMLIRRAQLDSRNRVAGVINAKFESMRTEIIDSLQR